jgi:hypothetical protein
MSVECAYGVAASNDRSRLSWLVLSRLRGPARRGLPATFSQLLGEYHQHVNMYHGFSHMSHKHSPKVHSAELNQSLWRSGSVRDP